MGPAGQALERSAGAAPRALRAAAGLAASAAIVMAVHASEPGPDGSADPGARADALVRTMTLDEKIHLLHGTLGFAYEGRPAPAGAHGGAGFVAALPRLGIPALQLNDGPLGVRNIDGGPEGRATAMPSSQALAASFDPGLAFESGRIMGREARDRGFNVLLAGGANVERDAWNGRNFEYLGEDPVLAGRIVTAQLRGIQSQGVVSTVKHLVANSQETDRGFVDMAADERSLREIDLLPFEIAVKESGVGSVMCAYNKVNGVYACENARLLNTLKAEWGFKGWVMSDWGATHSTAQAANAGLDQEFWEERYFAGALKAAVEKGEVSAARIDDMVRRILRSLAAVGALDRDEPVRLVDAAAGLAVAQRVAENGIVLLENRNALLPLSADRLRTIAVIGRRADIGVLSGGGSSRVDAIGGVTLDDTPPGTDPDLAMFASTGWHHSSPLQAIRGIAPSAKVEFDPGEDVKAAARLAASADVAIVFAWQTRTEGEDLRSLSLPAGQDELIRKVAAANPRTIVVLQTGGSVLTPWAHEVGAVLEAWYPGNRGAEAIASILFGRINPSGRLPVSFPRAEADLPRPRPPEPRADASNPKTAPAHSPVVTLGEGLAVGYRWYDSQKKLPAYEFGYGLSYTTFAYSKLTVNRDLSVEFDLANTGKLSGTEVAQLYLEFPAQAGEPAKRLAGWARVELAPGERRRVRISADPYALRAWDTSTGEWRRPAGRYRMHVGASSRILPLAQEIDVRDVQPD
ncbi:MAG TPA: glycoside hydrolase family 3 C-terminal domain-containing protein [Steroidobacteraceae bacterium]|jgi:beta-glucosidase|nr:glycoside hydrolase family 3 C-terminal domain-containing protein [Steroidobacteraceae bacterium]